MDDLQLTIRSDALEAIVAHAREARPAECCGLLLGTGTRIDGAFRSRNLDPAPTRFRIDPRDHFAAIHAARGSGQSVLGVYHSHPTTPAVPSPSDLAEASYPEYLCLIVSPRLEPAEVRAFRIDAGTVLEEALSVSLL